ncbi:MAG: tRNA sulfurtransferase [Halobacteriaceae archaeon]
MDHVLVRYAEIGTKSRGVELEMLSRLRDRVAERLAGTDATGTVTLVRGRILVETPVPARVAQLVAPLPGVASTSPAVRTEPTVKAIAGTATEVDVGATFGVDTNIGGTVSVSSHRVNEVVGAEIEAASDATVDLDAPETWVEVDVREAGAFVFTTRYEGPGGFPVGSQAPVAALISGGIDSPVAAYEAMTRGSPVVPVYAYNRPYAAGDHLARFETILDRLQRFHPAGDWGYYRIDMEPVNEALSEVDTGRMLLQRAVMLRAAAHVAEEAGLAGVVTGESIGQKSSQTAANLAITSATVDLPVHRPLLTQTKAEITDRARTIDTFEVATVDSACRSIAPENPATALAQDRFEELAAAVDLDALTEEAIAGIEFVDR